MLAQQVPLFMSTKKNATMPLTGIREERVRGCEHKWLIITSHNNKTGLEQHWIQCQRCQWRTDAYADKALAIQEWSRRKREWKNQGR